MIYLFTANKNTFTMQAEGSLAIERPFSWLCVHSIEEMLTAMKEGFADGSDDPEEGDADAVFYGVPSLYDGFERWKSENPNNPYLPYLIEEDA